MTKPLQFKILPLVQPTGNKGKVDEPKIRALCAEGLSECPPEDRCIAWLVLLGVYPSDPLTWKEVRDDLFKTYRDFCDLFGVADWHTKHFKANVQKKALEVKDCSKMHVIHNDIVRTGRHIFFLPPGEVVEPYETACLAPFAEHMRRLERILYIFSECNRTLSYMQGFNELLPVLYYVNYQAPQLFDDDPLMIEAISFACLQQLLTTTEINVLYTTQDQSSLILYKMQVFQDILKKHSPESFETLQKLNIQPLLYSFRWFNLLFAQEYELPVLLIIWDTLLAHHDNLLEYAFYFGVASIMSKSDFLDVHDFAKTLTNLQNLKVSNVFVTIKRAKEMYQEDHKTVNFFEKMKNFIFV